jgi:ADP-dependent NAD(P)H-hydrate dehydratase / NAD(P)H-hydrate epimerase
MNPLPSCPILTRGDARALEAKLFGGDETKEWPAMQAAGRAIAEAILDDFREIGGLPANARIFLLAGKGHNGGDALLAAQVLLEKFPATRAEVVFVFGVRALRPLAARAWRELVHTCGARVRETAGTTPGAAYDLCLDGVFGFQFRPPAEERVVDLLTRTNALSVRLRAAVDLPSAGLFRADFTYATGSVKRPVVDAPEAGRVRYLDLGFFRGDEVGHDRVLPSSVLAPLAGLRAARSDKRAFGHVLIVGGSRNYPGAILMTVLAALRSGAGLVTAFVPESIAPAFAAHAPEAMWVGWPETPTGGLALEGEHLLRAKLERADAIVLGPGMGREPETLALAASIVKSSPLPLVIDADALQPEIVAVGSSPRILTPHAGEFARIEAAVAAAENFTLVRKGSVTRVSGHGGVTYHSFFGGPVLARGGSGDLLAGLIGGLLAQSRAESGSATLLAAARGVVWHGLAADLLARMHGQVAVSVTQLLDFLPAALRASAHEQ